MRFFVLVRLRVAHVWRPGWGPCWEGLAHGACCLEGKFPEGCAAKISRREARTAPRTPSNSKSSTKKRALCATLHRAQPALGLVFEQDLTHSALAVHPFRSTQLHSSHSSLSNPTTPLKLHLTYLHIAQLWYSFGVCFYPVNLRDSIFYQLCFTLV